MTRLPSQKTRPMLSDFTKDLLPGIHHCREVRTKQTRFLVKPRHSGSGQGPLTEPTRLRFRPIHKHANNSEATVCQDLILVM